MQIIRYDKPAKEEWDTFIARSKNGTFLLKRDYMDYHADRFTDCSHLFYDEKNRLLAVMPGNVEWESHLFYSHQGLTYGGLVLSFEITAVQVLEIMEDFLSYLKSVYGIQRVIYKAVPYIYHLYPAEEDLYALFRHKAVLAERKISSAIFCADALPFKQSRKGGISKAKRNGLAVSRTKHPEAYWNVLEHTLMEKHGVRPVHTLQEMELLISRFPQQIAIFEVNAGSDTLGGCVVYDTGKVAHIQYIAANEKGKLLGAIDLLFDELINRQYAHKVYIDFGVSTEQQGWYLNKGLIFQKEGFGARAIMYDTYWIEIADERV